MNTLETSEQKSKFSRIYQVNGYYLTVICYIWCQIVNALDDNLPVSGPFALTSNGNSLVKLHIRPGFVRPGLGSFALKVGSFALIIKKYLNEHNKYCNWN